MINSDLLTIMGLPFLACLLLAGIHVYFGVHIVARQVIFADLALAQIAALGSLVGSLLGFAGSDFALKAFSLGFALLGAAFFSLTRLQKTIIPQEASIGIAYATALAVAILVSAQFPHGADELREILAGNILWVSAGALWQTAVLYGAVGLVHFLYREPLLLISFAPHEAKQAGFSLGKWDFFFYASFAVVVTSSVAIAGVLLVFSYLIVPAVMATLLAHSLSKRLLIGWSVSVAVSLAGIWASYEWDLPSGPTIVIGLVLALACVIGFLLFSKARPI